jgi:hypothetical protein
MFFAPVAPVAPVDPSFNDGTSLHFSGLSLRKASSIASNTPDAQK